MITTIDITGSTGVSPYSVYVCDITNTYCYLVTGSTSIPPTFSFNVPSPLFGVDQLLVKIVDSNGCEDFNFYSCPPTPTPTPTQTPTPTPTPTNLCYCIEVINTGITNGLFSYIDCSSTLQENIIVPAGITYYVCGSNPTNISGLSISVGLLCVDNSCIEPTPTPTPSPLQVVCFNYVYDKVIGVIETITNTGYYNSRPYYTLTYGFVWYDSGTTLWTWSSTLGGGTIHDTLNNGGLFYPYSNSVVPYYPPWDNINFSLEYMNVSSVGGCA